MIWYTDEYDESDEYEKSDEYERTNKKKKMKQKIKHKIKQKIKHKIKQKIKQKFKKRKFGKRKKHHHYDYKKKVRWCESIEDVTSNNILSMQYKVKKKYKKFLMPLLLAYVRNPPNHF